RRHGARLEEIVEQQMLGHLVSDQSRDEERHGLAIDRSHARFSTAPSQRWQMSGCLADVPTSSSTCQQRAHFSPLASAGTTATPATSGRLKAPAGASPFTRSPPDVMQIS